MEGELDGRGRDEGRKEHAFFLFRNFEEPTGPGGIIFW
jgi:hypothetical protein